MKAIFSRLRSAAIDGRRYEYLRAGKGGPGIVLANGAGGPIEGWFRVLPKLEKLGTVFAWNRAGVGRSAKPVVAQTSEEVVRVLRELLLVADVAPPYLLVGHSIGGLHMNLFARAHCDEVCGVVLLDATAPGDVELMRRTESRLQRALMGLFGVLHDRRSLSEVAQAATSVAQVESAGAFPPLPLRVISGAKPAMAWLIPPAQREGRAENQRGLAALSPLGRQIVARRSGHFPQFSEPALVIETIRELARTTQPS